MTNYKGYYIDGVIYSNKQDVDNQILKNRLNQLKLAVREFERFPCYETAGYLSDKQEQLVKLHGYEWEEVENLTLKYQVEFYNQQ